MASHPLPAPRREHRNDAARSSSRRFRHFALAAAALVVAWSAVTFAAGEGPPPSFAVASLHAQRMAAAFVAGGALATAGVFVQAVAANPLADPTILGTSGAAYLGAQLGLLLSTLSSAPMSVRAASVVVGALAGATAALMLVLAATRRARDLEFLLTGFLLATTLAGLSSVVTALAQERPLLGRAMIMLGLGDLASAGWPELRVALPLALGAFGGALLRHRDLDLLALGHDEARSLGLEVDRARIAMVAWVACATASAVILGGQLAFVGLLAPHLARKLAGGAHARVVPLAALVGGLVVLASDRLAVKLAGHVSLPTGAITTLAGAPVFFVLLRSKVRVFADGTR
jgi:ABC-type Fe3+-siderophore transport system permease subunit